MLKIGDILDGEFCSVYKIIDVNEEEGYVVVLLLRDLYGPVDQQEDNIAEFVLFNDIFTPL